MTKKQIWIAIIGAGVVASITAAAGFFPEQRMFLIPMAGAVAAMISYLSGDKE